MHVCFPLSRCLADPHVDCLVTRVCLVNACPPNSEKEATHHAEMRDGHIVMPRTPRAKSCFVGIVSSLGVVEQMRDVWALSRQANPRSKVVRLMIA